MYIRAGFRPLLSQVSNTSGYNMTFCFQPLNTLCFKNKNNWPTKVNKNPTKPTPSQIIPLSIPTPKKVFCHLLGLPHKSQNQPHPPPFFSPKMQKNIGLLLALGLRLRFDAVRAERHLRAPGIRLGGLGQRFGRVRPGAIPRAGAGSGEG